MSTVGARQARAEPERSIRQGAANGSPRVPDHELHRIIGRGSYGEVWLARNAVGTWRAVKVVYRDRFKEHQPYEREFIGIQKYQSISRTNEGLVDALQIGRNEAEGYFYYVMELADDAGEPTGKLDGHPGENQVAPRIIAPVPSRVEALSPRAYVPRTLSLELHRRGRLSFDECVTLGLKLNLALGHLHRHGLIHRDVKPPNVIFVDGVPKLADIGLVANRVGAHSYVGTEGYIAPEGPNSPQADLYALGKLLYEASTGRDRQQFPNRPPPPIPRGSGTEPLLTQRRLADQDCLFQPLGRPTGLRAPVRREITGGADSERSRGHLDPSHRRLMA
jgi:serine/threonine protein kinase